TGLVPVIGLLRPVVMLGLPGPVAMLGLVRPVATLGLVGPIAMLGLVGPTAAPAVVVSLILGAGATPGWLNVGRRDDARATEVTTAHAHGAPAIVAHGPRAHPRDEGVRRRAVPEDEPGRGCVG